MQPLPPPKNRATPASRTHSGSRARDSSLLHSENHRPPPSSIPDTHIDAMVTDPAHPPAAPQRTDTTLTSKSTKKRKHRGGKKRKNRRQSFAAPSETEAGASTIEASNDPLIEGQMTSPPRFYRQRSGHLSDASLDSNALLDHRDQPMMRTRRESRVPGLHNASQRAGMYNSGISSQRSGNDRERRQQKNHAHLSSGDDSDPEDANDRTPLMSMPQKSPENRGYGLFKTRTRGSSASSRKKDKQIKSQSYQSQEYDVNNPPSVPGTPDLHAQYRATDAPDAGFLSGSPRSAGSLNRDALIDIDGDDRSARSRPSSSEFRPGNMQRHQTISFPVGGDVCFPSEAMSEMADEDFERTVSHTNGHRRRSRRREWPQLWALDEWSQQEKEQRDGNRGVKKISEPVLIQGRLRPKQHEWHRLVEDAPYRYTYFNDEFESTIHAQTISELVQPGGDFRELFIPDPPLLSDSSESEEEPEPEEKISTSPRSQAGTRDAPSIQGRLSTILNEKRSESQAPSTRASAANSGEHTPHAANNGPKIKAKKYGPRPTFWLDVQSPTEQEMRVLCKTFGIHALTSEDIMMQEAREKVELFRHYYFINYRTFEQDTNSEDYLEPINMYVVVFRQGILTFHFNQIPHPANVRRRIRQLTDYLILSSDWISYAIIDDITDVYQPLIHNIEAEVDDIDELILRAFHDTNELKGDVDGSDNENEKPSVSGIDMLRRIGECRKKVMALYRLLGNKADVIKGFAKRCNEQWEVAPKTEIGLYLGDIQDHILTMTSNLSHYETLLSRAHSNYLAQVSIRMNERQEQTSDVLGKLTVVGTIVLPMNIICGMWGMNVKVPGQDIDNLNWFWCITAGLLMFALVCYLFCKRVYGIV